MRLKLEISRDGVQAARGVVEFRVGQASVVQRIAIWPAIVTPGLNTHQLVRRQVVRHRTGWTDIVALIDHRPEGAVTIEGEPGSVAQTVCVDPATRSIFVVAQHRGKTI